MSRGPDPGDMEGPGHLPSLVITEHEGRTPIQEQITIRPELSSGRWEIAVFSVLYSMYPRRRFRFLQPYF
jgi:hypothetical protein